MKIYGVFLNYLVVFIFNSSNTIYLSSQPLPATSLSFSLAQRKELKETSTFPKFGFSFLSSLKETKQRKVRKRPELGGRNTNSSNHSMNSLRSNSISYFVAQIAYRNPRLNVDSKNLHSSKDLLVRNVFEWFITRKHEARSAGFGGEPPLSNIWRTQNWVDEVNL